VDAATTPDAPGPSVDAASPSDAPRTPDAAVDIRSAGCGMAATQVGPEYIEIMSGGVARRFYLRVMPGYSESTPSALILGLHGRDYDGIRMRDYLGLERFAPPGTIFVYPDALTRDWEGLSAGGWQNGPIPSRFDGIEDLTFIDDMIAWVESHYCVDTSRRFATGQSWGGDFSNVVGCYRGPVIRAFVSVAANSPYYLPTSGVAFPCEGETAAWVMHGKADPSFPPAVGDAVRDFWIGENGCTASSTPLTIEGAAADDACVEYTGCAQRTRYCSYTAATGHQIPFDWYARETMRFFESFPSTR
jgi:poly(3-hydroxybutyrate) depolymerase